MVKSSRFDNKSYLFKPKMFRNQSLKSLIEVINKFKYIVHISRFIYVQFHFICNSRIKLVDQVRCLLNLNINFLFMCSVVFVVFIWISLSQSLVM